MQVKTNLDGERCVEIFNLWWIVHEFIGLLLVASDFMHNVLSSLLLSVKLLSLPFQSEIKLMLRVSASFLMEGWKFIWDIEQRENDHSQTL